MENNPNQIPEDVLKEMEIDSERKYPFRSFGSSKNNNEQRYRRESYLQGRQDEWEKSLQERTQFIQNLLNEKDAEIERLNKWIKDYVMRTNEDYWDFVHKDMIDEEWRKFKLKHNL